MSRYIDINRLLDEIATDSRSASDPWTLSRSPKAITRDALKPGVLADVTTSPDELAREIQSARQIEQADAAASTRSQTGQASTSPSGSGLLQGLLNFFPLASGVMKLLGLGGGSSSPPLTTYQHPPAIAFEAALSGPLSDLSSFSYGADGFPRLAGATTKTIGAPVPAPSQPFASPESLLTNRGASQPADATRDIQLIASSTFGTTAGANETPFTNREQAPGDPGAPATQTQLPQVMAEMGALTGTAFSSLESETTAGTALGLQPTQDIGSYSPASFLGSPVADNPPLSTGSAHGLQRANGADMSTGHNILVQVQAMDSQSFLDHSQEIAQAVRQAMLNMHSVNDVISDL